jgi:TonB-linked SusC/RagA family outer membrane protein
MKITLLKLLMVISKYSLRLFIMQVICMNLVLANATNSQNLDDIKVSLSVDRAHIAQVLQEIERKTDFVFAYTESIQNAETFFTLEYDQMSLRKILEDISLQGRLQFKRINNTISVVHFPKERPQEPPIITLIMVTGRITDESDLPLPGVNVVLKGTTTGTTTDSEGRYSLSLRDEEGNGILVFSFIGYEATEVSIGGRTNIDVSLRQDITTLEEVVVIGYGTQEKSAVTGAISTMKAEEVTNIPVANLSNSLAGRLSGVFVNQASGAPGYAASIRVRSVNTWKDTGNDPLYVIDGVIADKQSFDAMDYSEVDNITVLKDAASGAIYGARAANGVILVTTKSGKAGEFKLSYNYSYTFDTPSKIPEYVGSADMVRLMNYTRTIKGLAPVYDAEEVAYFNENDPGKAWYDLAYRNPVLQRHVINASGGSENVRYFISGSAFDQTAFVKNADYKKYVFRSNLDVNFTKNLKGTFRFSYHNGINKRFAAQEDLDGGFEKEFETQHEFGYTWGRLLYYLADVPPKTADGHFINPGWIGNMLAMIEEGGTFTRTERNLDLQLELTYKVPFIEGLSLTGKLSPSYKGANIKLYELKTTLYDVVKRGTNSKIFTDEIIGPMKSAYPNKERLVKRQRTDNNYQLTFSANYIRSFGKHNVDAVFVYEQSEGTFDNFYGVREGFPLIQKDQFWATGSARADSYVGGSEREYGRASYIGRVAYNYDEKYLVNFTTRRDGSMLFGPDYRWGVFPSVSAGWLISEEDFFDSKVFDFLKLRGSWGLAGNDVVGGWKWAESFAVTGDYLFGTTPQPRVGYNGIANQRLTWEKTSEVNIGIDTRFLNSFMFSAEYYRRNNFDILDSRIASLPVSFGGSMPPENYGKVSPRGWELELGYNNQIGEVNFEVRSSFSYATNEVKLRDVAQNARDVDNPNGRPTDYVKMLVATDIIRTQSDLDALPAGYSIYGLAPKLGMINFQDVSGVTDGVPDGKIDDYDRQVLEGKHFLPPYTFGLNLNARWKGLGAGIFLQGVTGVSKLYNDGYGRRFFDGARPPVAWLDSWSPENTNASMPQAVSWDDSRDHLESTFWLKNGNYLRFQNVNLSYSLPKLLCQKMSISDVTFILQGTNLLTLSSFDFYDPTATEMRSYPTMKSYTMGVNVTF